MSSFEEGFKIGSLETENRGLREAIETWIAYAKEMEEKVKYLRKEADHYRWEAASGWTAWKAAEEIVEEEFCYSLKKHPDIRRIRNKFEDYAYEMIDRSMEKDVYGKESKAY